MTLDSRIADFMLRFLERSGVPDIVALSERLYEPFAVGRTPQAADEGARLYLAGIKTATSSLVWEYEAEGKPLPFVGAISALLDGRGAPVAMVETIETAIRTFDEIDEAFARDYGEWDRTLAGWRKGCWPYYEARCRQLGRKAAGDMPLLCERMRIVYRETE